MGRFGGLCRPEKRKNAPDWPYEGLRAPRGRIKTFCNPLFHKKDL